MQRSVTISVKGTYYYKASEIFDRGALSPETAIRLEHQPNNPHDRNAVAVKVKKTGEMLGFIPRGLAQKYALIISSGNLIKTSIANVEKNGKYINLEIRVWYDEPADQHNSRLSYSASLMPMVAGIYTIRNIDSGRQYIGSSMNLKSRLRTHIRELSLGNHPNHALQSDFSKLGADCFEAEALKKVTSPSLLTEFESNQIAELLNSGADLYNLTEDGRGAGGDKYSFKDSEPVSDRIARQRMVTEQRRLDEMIDAQKKAVRNAFDPQISDLLPKTSFWAYFIATFICTFVVLLAVVPGAASTVVLIVLGALAFVISALIRNNALEKAKNSPKYLDLVGQRDSKLRELENERRRLRKH